METKRNNDLRNTTISVKVSATEKAELQKMADDVHLSLSEFMRLKGLSKNSKAVNHEEKIKLLEDEINRLRVSLSYYNENENDSTGIMLLLTTKQRHIIETIFNNYYNDNKCLEHQIIKYLAEDVLTMHYDLKQVEVKLFNGSFVHLLLHEDIELPGLIQFSEEDFCEAFKEYKIKGHRQFNQVKRT